MGMDHKRRGAPPRLPAFYWYRHLFAGAAGLSLGLLVTLFVWLHKPEPAPCASPAPPEPARTNEAAAGHQDCAPRDPKEPNYDFYTVLEDQRSVDISKWGTDLPPEEEPPAEQDPVTPDSEAPSSVTQNPVATAPEPEPHIPPEGLFLLQIGSFKTLSSADNAKAQLALIGVETNIQRVTLNGQETMFRVRTLPLPDMRSLRQAQDLLLKHNVEYVVLRGAPAEPAAVPHTEP